jgi:two-component system sensor histidine kinase EvgS
VALSIISRHNGKIAVESEESVGTSARISLPIAPSVTQPDEPATHGAQEPSRAAHILVIEDDPLLRETIANILYLGGHRVTLAGDGEEGISLFKRGDYSMVFTDLGMTG